MKNKKLYDSLYEAGYHGNYDICHSHNIIKLLLKDAGKDSRILDIGCSQGSALVLLQHAGFKNLSGIDIADKAIEMCLDRGLLDVKVASATKLPFLESSFDFAYSSDVFEHLDITEVPKALFEVYRILAPSGACFLEIATIPETDKALQDITKSHGFDNLHLTNLSAQKWEVLFESAGFCSEFIFNKKRRADKKQLKRLKMKRTIPGFLVKLTKRS